MVYLMCTVKNCKKKISVKTNSMEQSPSSEANTPSINKEIPSTIWKMKLHYHVQKSLP
jgi:hypothetical protein